MVHQVILAYAILAVRDGDISGNVVKLQLTDTDYLQLAEVQIFGILE